MVWVLESDDQNYSEYDVSVLVSVWVSETDALKQAAYEMVNHLNKIYFSEDDDLVKVVQEINDLLQAKSYRQAIEFWNDCSYNIDNSSPIYWTVTDLSAKVYGSGAISFDKKKYLFLDAAAQAAPTNGLVNDHTCTACGNTRCSKRENSCWSCGNPI